MPSFAEDEEDDDGVVVPDDDVPLDEEVLDDELVLEVPDELDEPLLELVPDDVEDVLLFDVEVVVFGVVYPKRLPMIEDMSWFRIRAGRTIHVHFFGTAGKIHRI